jgi:hypothetical protein
MTPMPDTSSSSLVPVIVGAVLALSGTIVSNWLLQRRQAREEHKRKRAEKFQELVTAVYEHKHWLSQWDRETVYGEDVEVDVSPISKIDAITRVYFPSVIQQVEALSTASDAYQQWGLDAAQRRLSGEIQRISDGHDAAYQPYAAARAGILGDLRDIGKAEFGTLPAPWHQMLSMRFNAASRKEKTAWIIALLLAGFGVIFGLWAIYF